MNTNAFQIVSTRPATSGGDREISLPKNFQKHVYLLGTTRYNHVHPPKIVKQQVTIVLPYHANISWLRPCIFRSAACCVWCWMFVTNKFHAKHTAFSCLTLFLLQLLTSVATVNTGSGSTIVMKCWRVSCFFNWWCNIWPKRIFRCISNKRFSHDNLSCY